MCPADAMLTWNLYITVRGKQEKMITALLCWFLSFFNNEMNLHMIYFCKTIPIICKVSLWRVKRAI